MKAQARASERGVVSWTAHYLPAELIGIAAMLLAGLGVSLMTDSPVLIAIAAQLGWAVGSQSALTITRFAEQSRGEASAAARMREAARGVAAEFGFAERLDAFVIRPTAMILGVWLLGALWGLIVGKLAADAIFYAVTARAKPDAAVAAQTVPYKRSPASPRPGTM